MKNDFSQINVQVVRAEARAAWEEHTAKRIGVQEKIGASVHWWLVIVAAVFFALSAPHTAAIFNSITPVVGMIAPLGVEFGLLYAAFRRKKATETQERVPKTLWAMEMLLIIVSFAVNGAGAATAAMHGVGLEALSLADLVGRYGSLPFPTQVILLIAVLSAFFIPIGTLVAGEGLAALFLERRSGGSTLDQRWKEEGSKVEFSALQAAAMHIGVTPAAAAKWASSVVGGGASLAVAPLSATLSDQVLSVRPPETDNETDKTDRVDGQTSGRTVSPKLHKAIAHLASNPDDMALSARELAAKLGIGHTTAAQAKKAQSSAGTDSSPQSPEQS